MMMTGQEQLGCKECIFLCLSFPLGFHFQYRSMEAAGKDKVKKAEACLVRNRKPLA